MQTTPKEPIIKFEKEMRRFHERYKDAEENASAQKRKTPRLPEASAGS